ncbi:MAG: sensor domain-containing diguanylate cyclase [Erysipelotrichaceae bacterium]
MKQIKKRTIPMFVLLISLLFSGIVIYFNQVKIMDQKREQVKYEASSQLSKLQYILDSLFLKTETLEMLVVQENGEVKNFDQVCAQLYDHKNAVRSLQLAPNGVVTYVYPLKGNEQAFGDLFADPDRAKEAEYARDTGNMTLAGPYELSQGGMGAVARRPIYLNDQMGNKKFWGFSIVILNIPDAFRPAEFEKFKEEGLDYKLTRIDPNTNKVVIIDESNKGELKDAINLSFKVPNGSWQFSVAPHDGWLATQSLISEILIGIFVSVILYYLSIFVVKTKQQSKVMKELSLRDNLTDLYNQRMLLNTMDELIVNQKSFGLLYLDFDDFKGINDTYGHAIGDLFLIESANRLLKNFSEYASIYRIGGDEFAMIIEGCKQEDCYQELSNKMETVFSTPFVIENKHIDVRVSFGISRFPELASDIDKMIRTADKLMYKMKNDHKK